MCRNPGSVASTSADRRRATIAAFLANLGIAVAKFVGFAFTGAASMLAEAIHSVADTSNQGLLLLGGMSLRTAVAESRDLKGGLSWPQFVRQSKVPELPVVLRKTPGRSSGSPSR